MSRLLEEERAGILIASLSGIRGVLNDDLQLPDVARFARNFVIATDAKEVLLARDPRSTGPAICRAAAAAMVSRGATVLDQGVISTPALFRQSRVSGLPALMVTASHNEPRFNGLKFVVDGAGIGEEMFRKVTQVECKSMQFAPGSVRRGGKTSYVGDLLERFGEGSCQGVKVALDLGGGSAISHAPQLLRRMGCKVSTLNDSYGIFNRRIDPIGDSLDLLRKTVKETGADIGLGFDCDGDRLAVVDSAGAKRTGDYMLTLAIAEILRDHSESKVVVSMDTTVAVDEVAERNGAKVYRSKVGEANVVRLMSQEGARIGGEGSSGGLMDGSFNYCRDSMLAALVIAKGLKREGRAIYRSVPTYHQERTVLEIPRPKAERGMKKLARMHENVDTTDGVKVTLSRRSWVLVRASGTEDVVRVSAEAETSDKASKAVRKFAAKLRELSS